MAAALFHVLVHPARGVLIGFPGGHGRPQWSRDPEVTRAQYAPCFRDRDHLQNWVIERGGTFTGELLSAELKQVWPSKGGMATGEDCAAMLVCNPWGD